MAHSEYDTESHIIHMMKNNSTMTNTYKRKLFNYLNELGKAKNGMSCSFDVYQIITRLEENSVLTANDDGKITFKPNALSDNTLWELYLCMVRMIQSTNRAEVIEEARGEHNKQQKLFRKEIQLIPKTNAPAMRIKHDDTLYADKPLY